MQEEKKHKQRTRKERSGQTMLIDQQNAFHM